MTRDTTSPTSRSPLLPGLWITFAKPDLQVLLDTLRDRGYWVVGPTVQEGAIVYDKVRAVDDLPVGLTDEQDAGMYRLKERDDGAYFGFVVGPQAWKKFLHPPHLRLWRAQRVNGRVEVIAEGESPPRHAFLGVRACELAAIAVQDQVFSAGPFVDPYYQARREGTFIIAVNCTQAGGTCFCVSMGTGPQVRGDFDIALTELDDRFLAQVGSERGGEVLAAVPRQMATAAERDEAAARVEQAARQMGRKMETSGIKELLYSNLEHPRWDDVARRCLTCANCTLVCPTCFCFTVEDVTDLTGEQAERVRRWDSCFTTAFTYTAGHPIRQSAKARYRQWLVHKLAAWIDQFGTSGCVGCGRCITWCPVGIDITEEVAAIRSSGTAGS